MEAEMKQMKSPDTAKLSLLLGAYQDFAGKFEKDSLSPEYLFKAGGIAMSLEKYELAVSIFDSVEKNYPSYRKAPECLFMEAFIYENNLHDLGKAGLLYNQFIAKYPMNNMVDDAQNALRYLGKPAEEMIRDFEARNKALADSLDKAGK
jgi:outer membrane protein assembly factor BamD (BamD/ComL family)